MTRQYAFGYVEREEWGKIPAWEPAVLPLALVGG